MISNRKHFAPILMLLMFALYCRTTFASSKTMGNLKNLNQPYGEADYIRFDKLMSEIFSSFKAKSKSSLTPQEKLMLRLAFNMAMLKRKEMSQAIKVNSWFLRQGR
jgi:hypothetical protein